MSAPVFAFPLRARAFSPFPFPLSLPSLSASVSYRHGSILARFRSWLSLADSILISEISSSFRAFCCAGRQAEDRRGRSARRSEHARRSRALGGRRTSNTGRTRCRDVFAEQETFFAFVPVGGMPGAPEVRRKRDILQDLAEQIRNREPRFGSVFFLLLRGQRLARLRTACSR